MKKISITRCLILITAAIIVFQSSYFPLNRASADSDEIRGVWVATVLGLDFPKEATKNDDILKTRLDDIVNKAFECGLNTIYFQVRPSCDALYSSEIFPWSVYLTGEYGVAPENNFDPLEYIINKAHSKGITLHAWINPYRVTMYDTDPVPEFASDISFKGGDGKTYLDPGRDESRELVIKGIEEIIHNYDVDGIHLDDYFYPSSSFDDKATFNTYPRGFSNIEDWRRDNITTLITDIKTTIKDYDSSIVFSVSPAGIWDNKKNNSSGSNTSGHSTYSQSYADTRLWVKKNIVDVIIPQIYWENGNSAADYKTLLDWWSEVQSGTNTKLVIGLGAYRADEAKTGSIWYGTNELSKQISQLRAKTQVSGYSVYRLGSINNGISEMLKSKNSSQIFSDIDNQPWAKQSIENMYKKGIINGYEDGTFKGTGKITRADFTLLLTRVSGKTAEFTNNFSDVLPTKYYYKEIGMAKTLGLAGGVGDNNFMPEANITRQDMAVLVYRFLDSEGKISSFSTVNYAEFADGEEIREYARNPVSALTEMKILKGYEDGSFQPYGLVTRAETAVVIERLSALL